MRRRLGQPRVGAGREVLGVAYGCGGAARYASLAHHTAALPANHLQLNLPRASGPPGRAPHGG